MGDLGWVAASVFGNATKMVTRTVRQGSGVSKRIRTATVEGWALLDIPAGLCRLEEPPNLLGILFSFVSPAMRVLPFAHLLGRRRKGRCSADGRIFVPNIRQRV